MTEDISFDFATVAEFLAHANALEQELAQRYQEMADCMEVHNNSEVASLFRQLSEYGEIHAGKLIMQAESLDMPKVPPWKYQWLNMNGLENSMEATHYLMTTHQGLKLAIRMEEMSHRFYTRTMQGSTFQPVQERAEKMVDLKQQHLALLNDWLIAEAESQEKPPEDLDPPNMPE